MFVKNVFFKSLIIGSLGLGVLSSSTSAGSVGALKTFDLPLHPGDGLLPAGRVANSVNAIGAAAEANGVGASYVLLDSEGDVIALGRTNGSSSAALERARLAAVNAYMRDNGLALGPVIQGKDKQPGNYPLFRGASVVAIQVGGVTAGYLSVIVNPQRAPVEGTGSGWLADAQDGILGAGLNGLAADPSYQTDPFSTNPVWYDPTLNK